MRLSDCSAIPTPPHLLHINTPSLTDSLISLSGSPSNPAKVTRSPFAAPGGGATGSTRSWDASLAHSTRPWESTPLHEGGVGGVYDRMGIWI